MSSQRGNTNRSRPQKHKNKTAFKNTLHDTSQKTKLINSIQVSDVCARCKDKIEWKIKYKKYKPLSQPAKCVKCEQRNVKKAYHKMCTDCGRTSGLCTKCCEKKEIVEAPPSEKEQLKLDQEMKDVLESLPERKRRTFLRYLNKKAGEETTAEGIGEQKKDLMLKLDALKLGNGSDFGDFDDFDDDLCSDDGDTDSED